MTDPIVEARQKLAEPSPLDKAYEDRVRNRQHEEAKKRMSPDLGLPKLLERKRWEHFIPDSAFETVQAAFDRILVAQVSEAGDGETYSSESGVIIPDTTKSREKNESARGVIVSAGLLALDEMRTHGIDVGHTIVMMRNWPFRIWYDYIAGTHLYLMVLRAGDICASVDLVDELKSGRVKYDIRRNDKGDMEHVFVDEQGQMWNPANPHVQDEM